MNMKKNVFTLLIIFLIPTLVAAQKVLDINNSQLVILNYPMSFENLTKQFDGKVIYIDVMASWCKPCISELKESKKMESYFKENNIVRLYITIDNKEDIRKCIQILKNDTLSGYFVSLHSTEEPDSIFAKDIVALFMTDENGNIKISIPRYAIVNKKGEIVVKKAERPSNSTGLTNQLEKYNN
jgi:thiol-disulfide isomerase/thioredoxin